MLGPGAPASGVAVSTSVCGRQRSGSSTRRPHLRVGDTADRGQDSRNLEDRHSPVTGLGNIAAPTLPSGALSRMDDGAVVGRDVGVGIREPDPGSSRGHCAFEGNAGAWVSAQCPVICPADGWSRLRLAWQTPRALACSQPKLPVIWRHGIAKDTTLHIPPHRACKRIQWTYKYTVL